jgi:hypothetical protein
MPVVALTPCLQVVTAARAVRTMPVPVNFKFKLNLLSMPVPVAALAEVQT